MTLTDLQIPLFFIGVTLVYLTLTLVVYDVLIGREDLYKKMQPLPEDMWHPLILVVSALWPLYFPLLIRKLWRDKRKRDKEQKGAK